MHETATLTPINSPGRFTFRHGPSGARPSKPLILTLVLAVLAFAAAGGQARAQSSPLCKPGHVMFLAGENAVEFEIEIADTTAERAVGLMNRPSLEEQRGMLFVYPEPAPVSFWMRNTLIPLDILFMDESGVIQHIHENAVPMDETPIPGAAPDDPEPERTYVLELIAGSVAKHGLQIGQAMASDILDQTNAALACRRPFS